MYVPFESLSDSSRVWIYQANRSLREAEIQDISIRCEAFLTDWTAHGTALKAGFKIVYKRFVIIALDETPQHATGCSIDASVHFIQSLEQAYDIVLLDKMNVTYRQGDYIAYKPLSDFRKMAKDKAVTANTIVFNNLVLTKEELNTLWEVPASESWHARFF